MDCEKSRTKVHETMAPAQLQMLVTTETNFAQKHPDRGYTCKLSDLFGTEYNAEAVQDGGALFDPAMSGGEKDGYVFALSGCSGAPASKYHVTAVPEDSDSGMKAFCSDETGAVRFASDGSGDTCISSGQKVGSPGSVPVMID